MRSAPSIAGPANAAAGPDPAPARRVVPLVLTAAAAVSVLISSQIQLSMLDHGHAWWRLFAWQLGGWSFWAVVAPWVLRSGARLCRAEARPALWPLREGTKALALIALHLPVAAGVMVLLQPYVPVARFSWVQCLHHAVNSWPLTDLLGYCIGLLAGWGLAGFRDARQGELRRSRLETELARAQLEALRLQIQPHFLFNTLNSIAALVRRQRNDRALEMVLGLSTLLRLTLERAGQAEVRLAEELDFVRLYADLQRVRFSDRLTVVYDVTEECLDQPVPTLLLQPLVENAIRHGAGPRAAPVRIEVRARRFGDRLELAVADDGAGLPAGFELARHAGVGLGNTRSRLREVYGDGAALTLCARDGGGTVATLVLPATADPAPAAAPAAQQVAVG